MEMRLLLLALLCSLFFHSVSTKKVAVKVTSKNWGPLLDENDHALVIFADARPGACEPCDEALAVVEEFFANSPYNQTVKVLQVDCKKLEDLCLKYNAKSLPVIKLFSEGLGIYDFPMARIVPKALQSFLDTYTAAKLKTANSEQDLLDAVKEHKVAAVGFWEKAEGDDQLVFARAAAKLLDKMPFYRVLVTDATRSLVDRFNATHPIVLLSHVKSLKAVAFPATEKVTYKTLLEWIERNKPVYMEEVKGSYKEFADRGLPVLSLFVDYENEEEIHRAIGVFEEFMDEFRNRVVFTYQDGSDQQVVLQRFGVTKLPAVLAYLPSSRINYVFPPNKEFNVENLREFCENLATGKLRSHVIKESVPVDYVSTRVKYLVHDNYHSFLESNKSAVIFYHISLSRCEPCAEVLKIFEETAESLREIERLEFGRFNVELNPEILRMTNFPAIQLFTGSKKLAMTYDGLRTAEGLREWLVAHLPKADLIGTPFDFFTAKTRPKPATSGDATEPKREGQAEPRVLNEDVL